jgi:hypothetical protein
LRFHEILSNERISVKLPLKIKTPRKIDLIFRKTTVLQQTCTGRAQDESCVFMKFCLACQIAKNSKSKNSSNLHRPRSGYESCVFTKLCLTNGYGLSDIPKTQKPWKKKTCTGRFITAYESCFCIRFCLANWYGLSDYHQNSKSLEKIIQLFQKKKTTGLHQTCTGHAHSMKVAFLQNC